MKTLRVKSPEGRHITGHGSRERGGTFELPNELANIILDSQPDAFEAIESEDKSEEPQQETGEED